MTKITADHLARGAFVYIRQSTADQLVHNQESRRRQYGLADRTKQLGWATVEIIDDDLGRSGGGATRPGFERLLAAICEARVGAVFVSIPARPQRPRLAHADRVLWIGRDHHLTLERLYGEYGATGHLKLEHYEKLGRIEGSIEAAVEQALKAADSDPKVPKDKEARLALLRRGLIPWLAGIDADTGAPRRRVARLSEIPTEARPLVDHLIEQRLLSTDVAKGTKETTIEPAHEALLRQWGLLQGWLKEDAALLTLLDGIKHAARDWAANGKATSWLVHAEERLRAAERLLARPDLAANLEPTDKDYVASCRKAEHAAQARTQILINNHPNGIYDVAKGKVRIVEANGGLEELFGERNLINKDPRDVFDKVCSYMPKWQSDKFRSEQAELVGRLLDGDYDRAFPTIPIYFNNHKQFNNCAFMPLIYSFATPQAGVLRLRVIYIEVTGAIKKHQDGYYYCNLVDGQQPRDGLAPSNQPGDEVALDQCVSGAMMVKSMAARRR